MSVKNFVEAEKLVKAALLGVVGFMMGLSLWIMDSPPVWRLARVGLFAFVVYAYYVSLNQKLQEQDERAQQISRMAGHLTRFCALLTVLTIWVITLPYDRPLRGWVWPTAMLLVLSWPDAFFRWYLGLRRESEGSLGARVLRVALATMGLAGALYIGAQVIVIKDVLSSFGYGWADLFFVAPAETRERAAPQREPAAKSIYEMSDAELSALGIRRVPKKAPGKKP